MTAAAAFPSPRLYNDDLAPVLHAVRHWRTYNIFTLWANDVHSLGNYTFAIGLFALGLGVWQILLTFAIGAVALFAMLTLSGLMGSSTGLPFPVVSRIAFGIRGGRVAAVCRGSVAIVWFGIQTYLAAIVLSTLLVSLRPSLQPLLERDFLGLAILNWYSFLFLWAVQLAIVRYGLAMIRHFVAFAGPVVLITMLALAGHAFVDAGNTIAWVSDAPLTGGKMWGMIFAGAVLWVVIYGTFALNVCDFTRCCDKSGHAVVWGNLTGVLLNMMLFAIIVAVLSGAEFHIHGEVITDPADMVNSISQTGWRVAASLVLIVLTMAVNMVANFVAPNYMLADLLPKFLNFSRASVITAVIGLVILPWRLYDSPVAINFFLGGLGAILGPFFGLIMVDYWLIRRQKVNIPHLYSEDPTGDYFYRKGVNWRAFAALVPAAAVAFYLSMLPGNVSHFSWLIGAVLAAILHWFLSASIGPQCTAASGEPIGRPSH